MSDTGMSWEAIGAALPCPETLWTGVWQEVSAQAGKSWDVWAATYSALSALAGRNLHWQYYKTPMFGPSYVIVVAPTGTGKEFSCNVCAALLPPYYRVREAVQSGQALFTILADVTAKQKVKPAVPTLLLLSEWTKLRRLGGIQHSTLMQDLNALFHCSRNWNLTRSDRGEFGAGDRVMEPPTLTIFGNTTPDDLVAEVTEADINTGFLNRYLLLPGPTREWEFWPTDAAVIGDPKVTLRPLRDVLVEALGGKTWGEGKSYQLAFQPDAGLLFTRWGSNFFSGIMRESTVEANRKKRLHFYACHICLISAWSRGSEFVEQADVRMAQAVIEAAAKFTDLLWAQAPIPLTQWEKGDLATEALILAKVNEKPNTYNKLGLREALRRQGVTQEKLAKALKHMLQDGALLIHPETMRYILPKHRDELTRSDAFLLR